MYTNQQKFLKKQKTYIVIDPTKNVDDVYGDQF